ncbi:sodium/potassium-transporting ATPase subunit beta-1-like [Anopheles funestus]|uniref:Sodium/potassium-transporting ATPase subunit beta n=1 Tax=Anopheles funestus TaxID=62324 RepID=A0A4Y0BGS9_ANOFN|nr:sodium/potassium-transporting ATPase subunit beta-1-like [Anopheles funestus]XP_049279287.1 sodium/potassium-transporting ATPase subunit beta-1-like [Anopheles funestus]XP_049279288.1 sodium/potassium-transporting ATPase subunit beta-1-like [Anopheles funestus]XP_049279289.1 sodium/potassium-transporting ATPase subunit beta-1-like [Anopheles funestus]
MPAEKRTSQPRIVRTYEFPTKPEKQTLGQYLYNSQDGKILGRTAKNWAQLMLFYACFYIVLAALFAICMQGLLVTLNHQHPKWQLDESRIGTNPGVSYRPQPEDAEGPNSIQYIAANKTDVTGWVNLINEFLAPYADHTLLPGGGKNQVICDFNTPPSSGNVCAFDVKNLGACTASSGYGYSRSAPCIFIKLNRIYGWQPEFYEDVDDLPTDMPDNLVSHIRSLSPPERRQVWLSCKELTNSDEDLLGPIEYMPSQGFPAYYYPYMNVEGYLSPLVAVHLARPKPKTTINIECRAWAKNIVFRGGSRDRTGSVQISLRID